MYKFRARFGKSVLLLASVIYSILEKSYFANRPILGEIRAGTPGSKPGELVPDDSVQSLSGLMYYRGKKFAPIVF